MKPKVYRNLATPESRAFWSDDDEHQRYPRGLCHVCNQHARVLTHEVRGLKGRSRWNGESHVPNSYYTLEGLSNACSEACAQAEASAWIVEGRFDKVEIRGLP